MSSAWCLDPESRPECQSGIIEPFFDTCSSMSRYYHSSTFGNIEVGKHAIFLQDDDRQIEATIIDKRCERLDFAIAAHSGKTERIADAQVNLIDYPKR